MPGSAVSLADWVTEIVQSRSAGVSYWLRSEAIFAM
jgi:hypothetical protein